MVDRDRQFAGAYGIGDECDGRSVLLRSERHNAHLRVVPAAVGDSGHRGKRPAVLDLREQIRRRFPSNGIRHNVDLWNRREGGRVVEGDRFVGADAVGLAKPTSGIAAASTRSVVSGTLAKSIALSATSSAYV